MSYDLGIPDRLRAFGIPVELYPGWEKRGPATLSMSEPFVVVTHHTAGARSGIAPSLGLIISGKPGVSGPLANVLQDRQPDEDDHAIVCGAGRSNNAGLGGWQGISGNSRTRGHEIEHPGDFPLSEKRLDRAAQIDAALLWGTPAEKRLLECQHWEWAPNRKIDVSTDPAKGGRLDGNAYRARVARWLAWKAGGGSQPAPKPPPLPKAQEELMFIIKTVDPHTGKGTYVLLGPGVMTNIDDATAEFYWARAKYPLYNGPDSKGYDPLFAIARAKELGAWPFPDGGVSPQAALPAGQG